jgi:hypothetical protein
MTPLRATSHKREEQQQMKASKQRLLVNGYGQSKFYFGIDDVSGEYIVGIEHPESDVVLFLSGPVLASINGWIARNKANLKPTSIN